MALSTIKLFVGGLAWATGDASLKAAFDRFGRVKSALVITDRETGRSRGFGFVTYENAADAEKARVGMHGTSLDGRDIRVDFAEEKTSSGGGGSGGGGGGGERRERDSRGGGDAPRRQR